MTARVLIVAYGNPMRCDDGVAWRAAEILEREFHPPDVQILRLHQLTPELADTMSHFQRVIFVDAASAEQSRPGHIRIEELPAADSNDATRFSHVLSPKTVVALAAGLYGARVQAFSATVTGENFGHGESLSALVADALPELVAQIAALVRGTLSKA